MILVDSNVFMYAGGSEHPHKEPSIAFLRRVAGGEADACITVEILQEILHRYRSINRWEDGKKVYSLARRIVPIIEPITDEIIKESFKLLETYPDLLARDCLHAATCIVLKLEGIYSFDEDFDVIEGLKRYPPA